MSHHSAKQLAANQANAQLSTGPKTASGKSIASLNAIKTGLTGRTVLLPTEDAAQYEEHLLNVMLTYEPVGPAELALVQSIADAEWRLQRIPLLEYGIYARGAIEFSEIFPDVPAELRAHLIRDRTYSTYEKQFHNLQIQEGRIRRYRRADLDELAQCQTERLAKAKAERDQAAKTAQTSQVTAQPQTNTPTARQNGFEFSSAKINDMPNASGEQREVPARPNAA